MRTIDTIYINGSFVQPHGTEEAPLFNPATEEQIGTVRLGDEEDVDNAVSAAKAAFASQSQSSKAERVAMLHSLHDAVEARASDLTDAMREEYGAPASFIGFSVPHAATAFLHMAKTLDNYEFRRRIGHAEIEMRPAGVAAAITPWNSNYGFICSKLATAIAAGTTMVIKPSEMSAIQTQLITECLHAAGLPKGVFNIVNGYGHVVGAALSSHRDIAKISFTGSTVTGRAILQAASVTLKRVTLELGGKSPNIILDDADLNTAIPQVLAAGFANSGQACIAGTRILAPESRLAEIHDRLIQAVATLKVGDASDPAVKIGPMVSQKQWDRVQSYIRLGQEEGAGLIVGGEGRPEGLDRGWFVRPTIFSGVNNDMRIAREEIFGPVLCVIPYRDEAHALEIANDTAYGLQAYVFSSDIARAKRLAERIEAGRVVINGAPHEPLAPFGGFKQSGIGREFGTYGLESFLEPRAVLS
ncbi:MULTISPECIES: aldehyde dehydrogenase family protein [unclassified Rhizobium]|uniref:aldehyde dehydrogenase family protein n=1 Tax=unclassified Rhizobium TaxID=2613769 RepID=UPI000DE17921|nr:MULTISPECIES: aldehyde dehydrogenase family protein [unclassified Rhizobium]MBB3285207.1 aldehyde dehydrogenase (NAD+) [Rhizobium sp. BK252]MBB3399946.1 aldehyde dehydrogenase (NAD+) [Rhizobium sp. BK289]MBB3412526.1 aldehyde dehydrogenase (NAD+) [Rhizobium sp. BK284]MBB3480412.1 aldehyde dehydrogenase (NAD+) [Rhizobium sp. BK347]MDK4719085.1 aldehyde dehydrogenase family protein [Rhizobium sp. CNPSo 3968]